MQIVIDIPEKMYNEIVERENHSTVDSLILNGTPLPKGHGRLIDADELRAESFYVDGEELLSVNDLIITPTIIKADTTRKGE